MTARVNRKGYGEFRFVMAMQLAHRVSWFIAFGLWPPHVRCIVAIHQRVFAQAIDSMGVGVITTVTCTVKGAAVWLAEEDIIVE